MALVLAVLLVASHLHGRRHADVAASPVQNPLTQPPATQPPATQPPPTQPPVTQPPPTQPPLTQPPTQPPTQPQTPPTKTSNKNAQPPNKSNKKPKPGEIQVTLTTPTDEQKADVQAWLTDNLEDPNYQIVTWGKVISADIGGKTTRTGIRLKYRGVNARFAGLLHDTVFLLDDSGKVWAEEGLAGFELVSATIAMAQRHVEREKRKMEARKP
ncbi:MAG TPA: hypothetical protein VNH11_27810 [Pirellulales bacterium]|nr:hypothetical protein [Pirellulales bacterium]